MLQTKKIISVRVKAASIALQIGLDKCLTAYQSFLFNLVSFYKFLTAFDV